MQVFSKNKFLHTFSKLTKGLNLLADSRMLKLLDKNIDLLHQGKNVKISLPIIFLVITTISVYEETSET